MQNEKENKKIIQNCFERKLFKMINNEKFEITKIGKEFLMDKAKELYYASISLGRIPKEVTETVGVAVFLKTWLAVHNNNPAKAIFTIVKEVEPIGFKNFIEFNDEEVKPNKLPN